MIYKFTDKEGKVIEVPIEPWTWYVTYKDGSILKQFEDDGKFHQIGEVKQDDLYVATLTNGERAIDIPWHDGMKLIHKYRNFVFDHGTEQEKKIRVYIFGYKFGEQYHFNFIMPDGAIIQSPVDKITVVNK